MWPFTSYPERSSADVDGQTYDYIIVGGGTAGCAVAASLSEDPSVSVLVIERGHVKDSLMSRIPLVSQNFQMGDKLQVQSKRWSEVLPGSMGRRNRLWGVEGIGGGSRLNAMLWTRGIPGDYAAWAEMGLDDWSWDKVEPYFRKIENAVTHPRSKDRGHYGPVEVRHEQSPFQWEPYVDKAMQNVGLPTGDDYNSPATPAMGYFYVDKTINRRGERVSAFRAFLSKPVAIERQDRLTVCTGAIASRLELDGSKGLAAGVHIRPSQVASGVTATKDSFVRARREVILCSGALATPQLLMLSGVGPKASAERLGIPVVKELPDVGARLTDHYSIPIMLDFPRHETMLFLKGIWGLWHFILWLLFGTGLMSLGSNSSTVFARTDAIDPETMQIKRRDEKGQDTMDSSKSRNIPDLEVMIMAVNSYQKLPPPGLHPFTVYATLVQPHGEGRLELVSRNPLDYPRVTLPMLLDHRDTVTTRTAVRFAMRIAEEIQTSGYPYDTPFIIAPGTNPDVLIKLEEQPDVFDGTVLPAYKSKLSHIPSKEAKTWRNVTDEEIDEYAERASQTALHYGCTCRISNSDKTGVVDQQLLVHGFRNLRIADASVFPRTLSAHPMAPIVMIAQRCADFVKKDWEKRG